jgi:hypothetical protein
MASTVTAATATVQITESLTLAGSTVAGRTLALFQMWQRQTVGL